MTVDRLKSGHSAGIEEDKNTSQRPIGRLSAGPREPGELARCLPEWRFDILMQPVAAQTRGVACSAAGPPVRVLETSPVGPRAEFRPV